MPYSRSTELLDTVQTPSDLRGLDPGQLPQLADEIRGAQIGPRPATPQYTAIFADALTAEAERDDTIVAGYYSGHAQPVSLIVCDASFIGLELVLANPLALARPGARLVALIKPQFEVGPEQVGKGGIVRDPALYTEVCDRIETWLGHQGWDVLGVTPSPIAGARGSQEFLIAARLGVT